MYIQYNELNSKNIDHYPRNFKTLPLSSVNFNYTWETNFYDLLSVMS